MPSPGPIFVATDLSAGADEAIRQGDAHARAAGARLVVCHVGRFQPPSQMLFPQANTSATLQLTELRRQVAEELDRRILALTGREAAEAEVLIEDGIAHAVVVNKAEELGASLIVVGSSGESGIVRMLLGGSADRILRFAHCPVLVARPRLDAVGQILVATDFSDPSLPAVVAAGEQARLTGARLVILHCLEPIYLMPAPMFGGGAAPAFSPAELQARREQADRELRAALTRAAVEADVLVEQGPAAAVIVRTAELLKADLVVVGTRGQTGIRRVLLGSVAESVARLAPCSVLVVRLGDRP